MEMIVAADKNWGIGKAGKLLVSIPKDMKMFRQETMGNVVIMGRKTFESLPVNGPLQERENLILTRNPDYQTKGARVLHSMEELWETLKEYGDKRIFVAGGGEIYSQLLPFADVVHVTRIWNVYDSDTFFPDLDRNPEWVLAEESEEQTYFDLEYGFFKYIRKK